MYRTGLHRTARNLLAETAQGAHRQNSGSSTDASIRNGAAGGVPGATAMSGGGESASPSPTGSVRALAAEQHRRSVKREDGEEDDEGDDDGEDEDDEDRRGNNGMRVDEDESGGKLGEGGAATGGGHGGGTMLPSPDSAGGDSGPSSSSSSGKKKRKRPLLVEETLAAADATLPDLRKPQTMPASGGGTVFYSSDGLESTIGRGGKGRLSAWWDVFGDIARAAAGYNTRRPLGPRASDAEVYASSLRPTVVVQPASQQVSTWGQQQPGQQQQQLLRVRQMGGPGQCVFS